MENPQQYGFAPILTVILIVGMIAIVSFVSWHVYDADSKRAQNTSSRLNASHSQPTPADEETVISVPVRIAITRSNGQTMDFSVGKIGPNSKTIIYSAGKNFAKINARCVLIGVNGGSMEYVLEKSNDQWSVLCSGIEENPAKAQQFGVPTDFE